MKHSWKRICASGLSALLCLSLAASCGSPDTSEESSAAGTESGAEESTQGTWETDTSPITFDVYVNGSWWDIEWTTDIATRSTAYITEKTGVTINFIAPSGNETEKMNTMIASRSFPDMVLSNSYDVATQSMIDADLCLPLLQLADQYDETFYDVVTESQIEWFRKSDGNLYDYPNFSHSYDIATEKLEEEDPAFMADFASDTCLLARKDIYEAIGSPDLTTPEGFLDALEKAKELTSQSGETVSLLDLDENGANAVNYIREFAAIPNYNDDGSLHDWTTDPEFIRWVKVLREAYERGLISTDTFIDGRAQIDEKRQNAQYFLTFAGRSNIEICNTYLYNDMNGKETGVYYIPVDAMRNSNGDDPTINGKMLLNGWMNTYIMEGCKDPARAIRFLNYMNGEEGQHDAFWGEEGVTFDYVDGVETFKDFILDGSVPYEDLVKNYLVNELNWTWTNYNILPSYTSLLPQQYDPNDDIVEWVSQYLYFQPETIAITLEGGSDAAVAESNINQEWNTTFVSLVTAESEEAFDQIYDDFLAERDNLGFEIMQEARQEVVDTNRAKLE